MVFIPVLAERFLAKYVSSKMCLLLMKNWRKHVNNIDMVHRKPTEQQPYNYGLVCIRGDSWRQRLTDYRPTCYAPVFIMHLYADDRPTQLL